MGYGVEFTGKADEALGELPGMVAHAVLDQLEVLALDPIGLGRRSHFPYPPGRQIYQFWVHSDGRWWVTVFYRSSQDEQRIVVLDVAGLDVGE